MLVHRKILLVAATLAVIGPLTWTAGYGLHLRSSSYRQEVEADLSAFFELPCTVGAIRGRTFSSRAFHDVDIFLPDRRDRVFFCREAVWREENEQGRESNELDLVGGVLNLGSESWHKEDYRQVLESGLGHDFADLHLARVSMEAFEINFSRANLALYCRDTSGLLDFGDPAEGIARLHAYELNGRRVHQGVQIHARFQPTKGVRVSELALSVPRLPLESLGLGGVLGGEITRGSFEGSLEYRDEPEPEVWLRGELEDVQLSELTALLPFGPLKGALSVHVDAARVVRSVATHFRGRGRVQHLQLGPIAELIGLGNLSGEANFDLDAIELALGRVERLRFSGMVIGMSLEEWMTPLALGRATGVVIFRVNNVEIVNDDIKSADIEITVRPAEGEAGTLDRSLLMFAAQKWLNFTWPASVPERILPEKVEYEEFGVRLLVRDNLMRILGTHGPNGDTILTIRVAGMAFGVVKEQSGAVDLGPHLERLRERARSYRGEEVRQWWETRRGARN